MVSTTIHFNEIYFTEYTNIADWPLKAVLCISSPFRTEWGENPFRDPII